MKETFITANIKPIAGLSVLGLTYILFFVLAFQHVNDKEIISQILIASVGALTGVLGYYFGYSQGASKKDETIASQAVNAATTPTVTTADTVNIDQTTKP